MGVYIKGMEMPTSCDDCFLPLQYCPYAMKPDGSCPLVPVPPSNSPKTCEACSFYEKRKTNADRIRSMTDEELAEFFQNATFCDSCFIFKDECGTEKYSCKQRWLDWLKQEVNNG